MRRTPLACSRSSRKSAVLWLMCPPGVSAVAVASLVWREPLLRCAARAGHGDALGLDDLARVGRAVPLVLQPSARVAGALERVRVALLLRGAALLGAPPASEHGPPLPTRARFNHAAHRPRRCGWAHPALATLARATRPIRLVA